jgi:hypothetical protein
MIVLVCGGRDFYRQSVVFGVLDWVHGQHAITQIIHGGARGADSGKDRRHAHQVRSELQNAGWSISWAPDGDLCDACRPAQKKPRKIQPRLTSQDEEWLTDG